MNLHQIWLVVFLNCLVFSISWSFDLLILLYNSAELMITCTSMMFLIVIIICYVCFFSLEIHCDPLNYFFVILTGMKTKPSLAGAENNIHRHTHAHTLMPINWRIGMMSSLDIMIDESLCQWVKVNVISWASVLVQMSEM